ncbi:MAG: hypothetical protein AAGA75_20190, partial [Cyanobacteria bacterium P01_E01_bin.6]
RVLLKNKIPKIPEKRDGGLSPPSLFYGILFFCSSLSSSEDALTKVTAEEPESVPIGSTQP